MWEEQNEMYECQRKLVDHLWNSFFRCLVADVMVCFDGHSPDENNCKCFVCWVHMVFGTRAWVPNVPSPKTRLWTVCHLYYLKVRIWLPCCVKQAWEITSRIGRNNGPIFFLHWQGFCRLIHWLSLTVHMCGCALRGSTPVGTRDKKCCQKNQALYWTLAIS